MKFIYNPGQNSWDIKAMTCENGAFPNAKEQCATKQVKLANVLISMIKNPRTNS